jgi:DNA-binding GntR family transcriptional regulator
LNRLSRDGLVTHSEQRGFFVAPFSSDQLDELTKTRSWLNEIGLRESIKRGDDAWEERVVLAYHRLAKLPRHERGPSGQVTDAWESAHREFHASLVAGCGSAWLTRYCEQLFDAAERYRNLSRLLPNKLSTRSKDEHRAIMEAAVARDALTAVKLLNEHFERTARLVRSALRVGSSRPLALRSPA